MRRMILVASFGLLLPALCVAVSREDPEDYRDEYQQLVGRHADAVVSVRYVVTLNANGQEQRSEDGTQGTVVSADGLVLLPGRAVSVDVGALGDGGAGVAVANSSEFRVRLPGSDAWLAADFVTRDSDLGLAWIRVRGVKGLPHVDFSDLADPEPGRVYFTIMRTSEEWGSVPLVRPGLVLGQTRVPRTAYLVDGMPGLAFDGAGRPMGYVDFDFSAMSRGQPRGFGFDMADAVMRMLPARRVAAASAQARALSITEPPTGP